jgi:hypothetical protein
MADILKTPSISEAPKKKNNDTELGEVWEVLDPAAERSLVRKIDFRQVISPAWCNELYS